MHICFKIANITHTLPVSVYRQTDFKPKWVVVSRLHDTVARIRTGVKFSPRCENRGDSRRHNILWWYHVNTPIAQLLEQRTGIAEVTGSNSVEVLIFFYRCLVFFLFKVQVLRENKRVPLARTGTIYLLVWTPQKVQQVRRPPVKLKVALSQTTKINGNFHCQKEQHQLPLRKRLVALKTSFYWERVRWTPWSQRRMAYALQQVRENYFDVYIKFRKMI